VTNVSEILIFPETLRTKLGDDAAQDLAKLINTATRGAKESTVELMVERFERRLAETKTELVKWMFAFWVGQVAVTAGLIGLLYSALK